MFKRIFTKPDIIKQFTIIVLFFISVQTNQAQQISSSDTKLIKALGNSAFLGGKNIKFGTGFDYFKAIENNNPRNAGLNTFCLFVAYNESFQFTGSKVYGDFEFQFGRKQYKAKPFTSDTVSLTNCSAFEFYYFEFPFQLSYRKQIINNVYWAFKPGIYFNYAFGASSKLKNSGLEREAETHSSSVNRDMKPFDIGGIVSWELGIRAAFIGADIHFGWKNLAPETLQNTHTIKNVGSIHIYAGYRFGTEMGKSDVNKIKNIL